MKVLSYNGKFYLTGRRSEVNALLHRQAQSSFRGTPGEERNQEEARIERERKEFEQNQDVWGAGVVIPKSWNIELIDPYGSPMIHINDGGESFTAKMDKKQANNLLEMIHRTHPNSIPKHLPLKP